MEEHSCPNWNSLPTEIVQNILQLAAEKGPREYSCNYALVCKAWLHPTQNVLYSNITVRDMLQLRKFNDTVKSNAYLGTLVKVFDLRIFFIRTDDTEDPNKLEIVDRLTTLFSTSLPKLEEIKAYDIISYTPVLNAFSNSQLKYLKKLVPPDRNTDKSEIINYFKCAMLLKDRLESMSIYNDSRYFEEETTPAQLPFDDLFNNIPQFEMLRDIYIERETRQEVQALEYIVETCRTLNGIRSFFAPSQSERNLPFNDGVSMNAISNFTPRANIKTLSSSLYVSSNYKTLAYIIHKFSRLDKISIEMMRNSFDKIDQHLLTRLLYYLFKINDHWVNRLLVDPNSYVQSFRDFWDHTAKPGSKYVRLSYELWFQEGRVETTMSKSSEQRTTYTELTYPSPNLNNIIWLHMDFLKENGSFIRELLITLNMVNILIPDTWELPRNFMTQIFTYCPNLQYLYFRKCVLKQSLQAEIDTSSKLILKQLYITDCALYDDTLEQLSLSLPKTETLRLGSIWHLSDKPHSLELKHIAYEIIMPHTTIDKIIFEESGLSRATQFLKLYSHDEEFHYYYKYVWSTEKMETVTEQEYNNGIKYNRHMYLCCANKPEICVAGRSIYLL